MRLCVHELWLAFRQTCYHRVKLRSVSMSKISAVHFDPKIEVSGNLILINQNVVEDARIDSVGRILGYFVEFFVVFGRTIIIDLRPALLRERLCSQTIGGTHTRKGCVKFSEHLMERSIERRYECSGEIAHSS